MHKNRILLIALLEFVFATSGLFATSQQSPQMLVSTDWLAAHLKDSNVVVLAIGNDRRSYYSGHVPGSQFLLLRDIANMNAGGWFDFPPVDKLKSAFEQAGVGDRTHIVLYGDSKGLFAARAYFTLDYLGLGNRTSILDGGIEKWEAEHRLLSSDPVMSHPSTLRVTPHPLLIAALSAVIPVVSNKSVPMVDARAPKEFAGAKGGMGANRSGHIPGAVNVFWADNLVGTEIPTLKPIAAIRARYLAAGLRPGAKVIVYCHGGIQASFDYFTLKLAGYHPVLFGGSFAEYVAAFNTPVETSGD